jgi:hypothetical protein
VAGEYRVDGDAITGSEAVYLPTGLDDRSPELVAEYGRIANAAAELAPVDVEVRSADAGVLAGDHDLVAANLGLRHCTDSDVAIAIKDRRVHGSLLLGAAPALRNA